MEAALKDVKKFKKDGTKTLTVVKLNKLSSTVTDPKELSTFWTDVRKLAKAKKIECDPKMEAHLTALLTPPKKKKAKGKDVALKNIKKKHATGTGEKFTLQLLHDYDKKVPTEEIHAFWTELLSMVQNKEIECEKAGALKKHLSSVTKAPAVMKRKVFDYKEKVYPTEPKQGYGVLRRVLNDYLAKEKKGKITVKNTRTMMKKLEYDGLNDYDDLAQFINFVLLHKKEGPSFEVRDALYERASLIDTDDKRCKALDGMGRHLLITLRQWCKENNTDFKKMTHKKYWVEPKFKMGEEWMFNFEIEQRKRDGAIAYLEMPNMNWEESDSDNQLSLLSSRKKPEDKNYRGGMYCFPYKITPMMNEHLRMIPKDAEAFEGVFFTDEVWDIPEQQVNSITAAFTNAKKRQMKLATELNKMENFLLDGIGDANDRTMYVKARQFQTTMLSHFPYEFVSNQKIDLKTRLETIQQAKEWDEDEKREAIAQLQNPGGNTVKKETKAFEVAITSTQNLEATSRLEAEIMQLKTKSKDKKKFKSWWWYVDPFDDKATISLPWDVTKTLYEANEAIVERAYKIRDCGGSSKDVEKALKHIPPGFWPPQLVDRLQAWRRAEREMKREATLLKQVQAAKKAKAIDTLLKALIGATDSLPLTNEEKKKVETGFSNDETKTVEDAITKFHAWAEKVKPFAEEAEEYGIKREKFLELMWEGNLDALEVEDEQFKKKLRKWLGTFKKEDWLIYSTWVVGSPSYLTIFSTIQSATSAAGKAFAEFAPVVGTAMLGIEFMALVKKTRDAHAMKMKVVKEEKQLLKDQQGRLQQDVALLNCIANEKNARYRAVKENATYASARAISLAGGVADCTGVGSATVGLALKLVGTGVYYGGWFCFLLSDHISDKSMKKTLERARAGDYSARVEIFADSAVYAKMYLSMKVKDYISKRKKDDTYPLDPFIENFLLNRGITESDIDTSNPLCVRMLREALMQHAGQSNMGVAPKI